MPVDTRHVSGRRQVQYHSLHELLADVELLSGGGYRQLGNWNLGQICEHLAGSVKMGLDGSSIRFPWYLKMAGPLLKRRFITKPMPAGFKLPPKGAEELVPSNSADDQRGVEKLRHEVERWYRQPQRVPHPMFGPLTPEEWEQFTCRHAELHMSFLVPA
jgi:hypothetical protein